VKAKIEKLKPGLPQGVEIVPTYDRSSLIKRAVKNLEEKLIEEFVVVAIVCARLPLPHALGLRGDRVAAIGILAAYIVMHYQGVNANIMSLGGIAIAVGAMVDAAVVMIENAHKHIEAWDHAHPGETLAGEAHWRVIGDAAAQVGPALFFSLLIIVLSFVPVFTARGPGGAHVLPSRLHQDLRDGGRRGARGDPHPGADGLPHPRAHPERAKNPLNRLLIAAYRPLLEGVLRFPRATLLVALVVAVVSLWPASRLGGEFLPPLDEGDLLYMPTALPGLSAGKATELLQQTDRLIRTVPEVLRVFGKAGAPRPRPTPRRSRCSRPRSS
jgi:Cu(I)/Ag(I) efflux system membrane protein CusA/SilA